MSELSNRYAQIIKDLQNNIKDQEDKEFVISKIQELSMMFIDIIDRLTSLSDLKIKEVEAKQKEINEKMLKIQKVVDEIESDIYEFEIICPYCNHEFTTEISSEISTDVECPECHNTIELDWNGEDEECEHDCSMCGHECVAEEEEEYEIEKRSVKNEKNSKSSKNKEIKEDKEEQNDDEDM